MVSGMASMRTASGRNVRPTRPDCTVAAAALTIAENPNVRRASRHLPWRRGGRGANSPACALIGRSSKRRWPTGVAKPTRLGRITPTGQTSTALSVRRDGAVAQQSRRRIDHQVLAHAAAGEREHLLAVDLGRGAHAQLAEDAAVEVEQQLRVRRVHRAGRGRSGRSAARSCRGRRPRPAACSGRSSRRTGRSGCPRRTAAGPSCGARR